MIQFYCPDIALDPIMPEEEARHCIRVLRKSIGDTVTVIDGKGHRYDCKILSDNPRRTELQIISTADVRQVWDTFITIAVAPTKNMDRMEWMVEKLTEIGVNRIVPLRCEHSERKEIKIERLNKIAVSAMKQSLKATVPEICPLVPLKTFISGDNSDEKYVGYCSDEVERKLLATTCTPGCKSVSILIGPEGDFSPEEIKATIGSGFVPVTFGDNRLRTETAALVACDTIHIINQIKS